MIAASGSDFSVLTRRSSGAAHRPSPQHLGDDISAEDAGELVADKAIRSTAADMIGRIGQAVGAQKLALLGRAAGDGAKRSPAMQPFDGRDIEAAMDAKEAEHDGAAILAAGGEGGRALGGGARRRPVSPMARRSFDPAKRWARPQSLSASGAGRRRSMMSSRTSIAAEMRATGVIDLDFLHGAPHG